MSRVSFESPATHNPGVKEPVVVGAATPWAWVADGVGRSADPAS